MNLKTASWVLLGVSVIYGIPNAASAGGAGYFAHDFLVGSSYIPPSVFVRENVPYYALYPPVYYSYPVHAPYGLSPFAYPPYGYGYGSAYGHCGRQMTTASSNSPLTVQNRYLSGSSVAGPKPTQTAIKPLRIVNRFVVASRNSTRKPTDSQPTNLASARPQVVYPAAMAGLLR